LAAVIFAAGLAIASPAMAASLDEALALVIAAGAKAAKSSGYGPRCHPLTHEWAMHHGVDIAAPVGTPILAPVAAVVARKYEAEREGLSVVLCTEDGAELFFFHLSKVAAKVGDQVAAGKVLGLVGDTGAATAPHLHFAVKRRGKFVDPSKYLAAIRRQSEVDMAAGEKGDK
jgi:murein DD-endopeptidase MepM/ murein hydrolase activator NlpD